VTHSFLLHCLGAPALFTAAGEQVGFRTRKHLALLVRLALEPGKQFTRDYLADLLWPDAAPKFANHSLSQGLSVIKAKIAREAVVIQRATVGLAAGWIDVDLNHLASNDVAIDGPFLDGFEIAAARPFEDWKDEFRARLAPQVRDCLVRQMDAARRIGDFPTVQHHAERLQDLDPLAEEAIRGIMEARAWASDRSGALKAFARYEAKLAEELGAKPGPDLVRMVDLLRDGRRSPRRGAVPGYPPERADRRFEPETLIGREREFSVLSDAWQEVRRKSPRIVVVTSDPGVGKTTLVNAFASSCQMDGAVVARAQAYDAERELPFAVLGELVKQLASQRAIGGADPEALSELTRISSEILRAFPGVPKPVEWSPELTPLRIADAFLKTITAAAADCPVMLVVDDLHAADTASTAVFHSVARKINDTRVLLIFTGRTSELRVSGAPWGLTSDPSIGAMRVLDLEVLPNEIAKRLIGQLVGAVTIANPPIDRILRASGGNPLAIELLTREWAEHGTASLLFDLETLDTHPVPSLGIPRAIGVVFERQSRRLDATTRATLALGAILGRRLTDLALYAALDISPASAVEALSRLREEGFLREVRGDLEFRNELIRAQAYYAVTSSFRLHLHRRIAQLLAEREPIGDPAGTLEIAWHYLRGASGHLAIPFAHRGAETFLAIGAPQEAEEVLRALLDVQQSPSLLRHTRMLLTRALLDQSKGDLAIPLVTRLAAEEGLSPNEQAEIAMFRASAEFLLNNEPGEKYCEVARTALEYANRAGDPNLIARALFECARAGTEQGLTELVTLAEDGIRQLRDTLDISTMPIAVLTQTFCRLFFLRPAGCLQDLQHTAEVNGRRANAAEMALIYSGVGLVSLALCRLKDAFDAYSTAFELSKKVGDDARVSVMASNICVVQLARGLCDDAIRWGEMSVTFGEASKSSLLQTTYTNLVDAYVLGGRESDAIICMERAREWLVPRRRWRFHCGFLMVNAAFALIQGNTSLALECIDRLEAVARGREEAVPIPGSYWKLRIFKAAHLGSPEEANRLVRLAVALFRNSCPMYYLDVLAAKTWLESRTQGGNSSETLKELSIFDEVGAVGRRALLTAQGFLRPAPSLDQVTLHRLERSDQLQLRSKAALP
jgi:DNA-binding SARP family transcriptional activator